ncbi:jg21883 [Pararge aegeria aegeria]|uniref:Jg21883 protein n=1 Tax=Pararge aegeria aegeria TaxID=348720 RepID=A0A8S4QCG6_9NEOP|nr:jg21883 [Pararge aegeria aegeria]
MGGIQYPHLTKITRDIWEWCESKQLFIFASYIKSSDNIIADYESRRNHPDIEWELADWAFDSLISTFGNPNIDLFASRINNKCATYISWHRDPDAFAIDSFTLPSNTRLDYPGGRLIVREAFSSKGIPESSLEIMLASLAPNSVKQYDVYLKKWWYFCQTNSINMYDTSVPTLISFLTQFFNDGCQYGTLNSCKSALSLILSPKLVNDDSIKRFLKGVFRLKPPKPKYDVTWDANLVLDKLSLWYPNEELTLDKLTSKTITLLALSTAQRVQTLSKIKVSNVQNLSQRITIKIPDIIKTSRPGSQQPTIHLPFFMEKTAICPASTLLCYIERTSPLRTSDELFVGIRNPHKPVGTQTLSRWIKRTLCECGVDTSVFSAHSTRHAASSRAHSLGVSLDTIRKTAGWSRNSTTFAKYYQRDIVIQDDTTLAESIINQN